MLEKRPKSSLRTGLTYGKNSRVTTFDVLGLPEGQQAEIAERRKVWQIRRASNDGLYGDWYGRFENSDKAMASLN
ncbi:MAG TPA: hypothetical protein VN976_16350 [Verrucomicrobiae bacterium]|jgi:hypothetical protein|nr:hypothetical protein [Verrucomicrobiae bacterium]